MSPLFAASTAAESAVTSQGWATAVGTGSRLLHLANSCSYFPLPVVAVPVAWLIFMPPVLLRERCSNRGACLLQTEGEANRDGDAQREAGAKAIW